MRPQVLIHYFAASKTTVYELPVEYNAFAWELDPRHVWWPQVHVLHKMMDVHMLTPAQRHNWNAVVSRRANNFFAKRMRQAHITEDNFRFRSDGGPRQSERTSSAQAALASLNGEPSSADHGTAPANASVRAVGTPIDWAALALRRASLAPAADPRASAAEQHQRPRAQRAPANAHRPSVSQKWVLEAKLAK